jgi:ankyrin repeat protein
MEDAILKNDVETVQVLLEAGHNPNSKSDTGTPLIFLTENLEILKLLLDYGSDPLLPDENGFILQDYCDNDEIISLLKKPRNVIMVSESKLIKYNETFSRRKKRARTLKISKIKEPPEVKEQQQSLQSDLSS